MAVEIRVPQLGESVVEATVARWLKREGEAVAVGDAVVELETEKVNVEVPADAAGVLTRIAHGEGDTVRVGDVLGVLDGQAEAGGTGTQPAAAQAVLAAPAAPAPQEPAPEAPPVSPVARRLAEEHGIDASRVAGSGPGGRVMKEDVLGLVEREAAGAAAPAPAPAPPLPPAPAQPPPAPATPATAAPAAVEAPAPPPVEAVPAPRPVVRGEERVRLSRRRLTIARRLVEAQQSAAMLTTFNEVDLTAVMDVRKRRRDSFKERHGVSLGFMSFFTRASVAALKVFPALNAELDGDFLVLKRYYDVGIAVSTDDGLVVPVVRDADRKTFAEIEAEIARLAQRARDRQLTLEELRGGTFTITNGGVFGSLLSTPILNPPQVGILGMHKIEERPVALNGEVVIRPMMYVALTYDHRVVDGREAVSFLVRIKELIEDPERLLLEG
jgi:2-oxoglutarate dehydrogenase E2 component (dihydrolipoamide succinyltransferase)